MNYAPGLGFLKVPGGNKSNQIKQILKIGMMDMQWTLPSRMEKNPMAWIISVNGFIVDARSLPRSVQEEAYRKGLIPYIPERRDAE